MNKDTLHKLISRSLRAQGFCIRRNRILAPPSNDKISVRQLHRLSVQHQIDLAEPALRSNESGLLSKIARGEEVAPEHIRPALVQIESDSFDSHLFRYTTLHWSIPISSGYGRRLRFLIIDRQNEKLIGILGLADPVFSQNSRDMWIGWSAEDRRERLQHVMEAFVLGAVPPYSMLLCGKLVAMLVASCEVREAFRKKYRDRRAQISGRQFDGRLALVTTTSALGRSSIYNRLKYDGRLLFESVGFTRGSGDFHFSNGLYHMISQYVNRYCEPTAKDERWGKGFRNRREVIRKCLAKVGLPNQWAFHGVQREVFVAPLARNARQFLRNEHSRLVWYHQSIEDLFNFFRERWLLPRAQWDKRYLEFCPESYRLWKK